jgi:hypothetical protein
MSFGLPVCCVNTGSVAEILGPRCLFSYEPGNIESMVSAIREALCCSDLPKRGQEARELALINHSPDLVAATLAGSLC